MQAHLLGISHVHSHNADILSFADTEGDDFVSRLFQRIVTSREEGDVCTCLLSAWDILLGCLGSSGPRDASSFANALPKPPAPPVINAVYFTCQRSLEMNQGWDPDHY